MSKIDVTNVSTKDLAAFLGMTRDGVTRLNRQGVIQQNGRARGKYVLTDAVNAYVTYLRENKDDANVKLLRQRERKLRLANDKIDDGLVDIVVAAEVFRAYSDTFREILFGELPRIAARLAACDDPREVASMLKSDLEAISQQHNDDTFGAIGALENGR